MDIAYNTINKKERLKDSEKHLSYHIIKFQKDKIIKDYYKFQRNGENNIQILEKLFNDDGIYNDLFKLSNNTI